MLSFTRTAISEFVAVDGLPSRSASSISEEQPTLLQENNSTESISQSSKTFPPAETPSTSLPVTVPSVNFTTSTPSNSKQDTSLPLPIENTTSSFFNSTQKNSSTISIPSVSDDYAKTRETTKICPFLDSYTTDIDTEISAWLGNDFNNTETEAECNSNPHHKQKFSFVESTLRSSSRSTFQSS
ncbi:hypothetical protein AVEN_14540-1 [Araneus ventricosus]|uniref:Uncharacterized protein n=1 Tax=Araneus ventricosus TaxID=182803 RepID=A0A4Y2CGP4_ARAVE|nr:hypothetical protein AVEN_14540-1 [Araneus ventricosus]